MSNELVSIVMSTYNGEKYLRQQMNSIIEQTHQNFELIVVDDASIDNTLLILEEYAALDDRIHVFPAEINLGLVDNFERGLKLAKGNFIALSDQDDIFRKDKIELLLAALTSHPQYDLAISDLSLIDEVGAQFAPSMWRYSVLKPKQGKPFRRLIYSNFATGCAMMVRRRLLDLATPFPPGCIVHDWWLAVVAASSRGGGIYLVDKQLTAYRQHGSNALGAQKGNTLKMRAVIHRIVSAPRGRAFFEGKMSIYKLDLERLTGYLERSTWSVEDRKLLEKSRELFADYTSSANIKFFSRISKLPQRLLHAWITAGLAACLAVVLQTIAPYK